MQKSAWEKLILKMEDFEMKKGLTSFVNPYSMLLLKNSPAIVDGIDHWHIDGISLVRYISKIFKKDINRFSFDDTSVAPLVFEFAKEKSLSIAVVGTKEEIIHTAIKNLKNKYGIEIAFYRNGYFKDAQDRINCLKKIQNDKIDIVICGMGTPYQESFLIDLKSSGWNGYGFTCGGYLHQVAQNENYYPTFFDKFNIRWIYRIWDEPKLLRRYMIEYPKFFFQFYLFKKNY